MLEHAVESCRLVSSGEGGWTLLRVAPEAEEKGMWRFVDLDTRYEEEMAVSVLEADVRVSSCRAAEHVVCLARVAAFCSVMGSESEGKYMATPE